MIYCSDREAIDSIIETGRQLYSQGLTVGTDGNISCLVSDNALWTTATGARKGFLTQDWLVKTDLQGKILEGSRAPSSELKMHLVPLPAQPTGPGRRAHPSALLHCLRRRPPEL